MQVERSRREERDGRHLRGGHDGTRGDAHSKYLVTHTRCVTHCGRSDAVAVRRVGSAPANEGGIISRSISLANRHLNYPFCNA